MLSAKALDWAQPQAQAVPEQLQGKCVRKLSSSCSLWHSNNDSNDTVVLRAIQLIVLARHSNDSVTDAA